MANLIGRSTDTPRTRMVSLTGQTQVRNISNLSLTSYGQRALISMDGECMRA
jgi:hypothetical protein